MPSRSLPEALVRAAIQSSAEGTDADLLGRFVAASDATAFAEIVRRHGPMVLGVCRRALGDTPDADDAFQAVWLVLVRKARSVSPRNRVGNWLYGVAARTAAHSRSKSARRRTHHELPDVPDPRPHDHDAAELAAVVDAELARLPDKYRVAVVLCELEARSLQDAAGQLGVPLGTIASRLARGRALLAARLKARGFAAAALAGLLAAPPVSARLTDLALALLTAGPREVSRSVSELTHGVLAAMLAQKLKAAGRVVVAVALAAGAVVWAATAGAQPAPPPAPPPQSGPPVANQVNPYAGLLDPKLPRRSREEIAWDDLLLDDPHASRAVLDLAASPAATVALLKQKLQPLKADKADVKKWIADLASEADGVWQPAFLKLSYFDPRLVFDPEEAFAEAKTPPAKQRLGAVLTESPDPNRFPRPRENQVIEVRKSLPNARAGNFTYALSVGTALGDARITDQTFPVPSRVDLIRKPAWTRDVRAIVVLERIGTPEAQALLRELAAGHPEALATRTAKDALDRLNPKAP